MELKKVQPREPKQRSHGAKTMFIGKVLLRIEALGSARFFFNIWIVVKTRAGLQRVSSRGENVLLWSGL